MKKLKIILGSLMLVLVIVACSACGSASTTSYRPDMSTYSQTQSGTTQSSSAAMTSSQPGTTNSSAAPRPSVVVTATKPQITGSYPATTSKPYTTSAPAYTTALPTTSGGGGTVYATTTTPSGNIGLSAGGAKDISNFRENIKNNYLPLPSDITYEGLFYDYYFDTGASAPARKLFSPSYSTAVTRDPFSNQTEYYLSVGLNCGLKEADFKRKPLNLVIVLDNSGSMNEQYNRYYYDGRGNQIDAYAEEGVIRKSKMDSANESAVAILDQLNKDDWVSIVTFNSQAALVQSMVSVSKTNLARLTSNVLDILPGGSTNLDAGLDMAIKEMQKSDKYGNSAYENRIMVITDAQPNTGDYNSSNLLNLLEKQASKSVFTTFIGVGVDFNSDLIEKISKTKGCNYYAVRSPRNFKQRIEDEFEYMVTPLIFDVELSIDSSGWKVEKVFGSPQADQSSGRIMRIDTMFASKSDSSGQVKGGLVLLKLKKISSGNSSIQLRTSYEDRYGRQDGDVQTINLETLQPEYFDNTGIHKGVLLVRYAALLKNWMMEERQYTQADNWKPCVSDRDGIVLPSETYPGAWERQSISLKISQGYRALFDQFSDYFESEMDTLEDNDLDQELDILNRLQR